MSYDSLILRSFVVQLNEIIGGGAEILSIAQSSPYEFAIRILADNGTAHNLLFSIHPAYARAHIIRNMPKKDKRWHFADFLQMHLWKGRISLVEQADFDRIIRIHIIPQEEFADPKTLIVEFMGKHSNAILVNNTGKILESIKHIDENMSRYRQVLPGAIYVMPPSSQSLDFFCADDEAILKALSQDEMIAHNIPPIWKRLLNSFQGMSPVLAKEIVARSSDNTSESVKNSLLQMREEILSSKFSPNVIVDEQNSAVAVSAIRLKQFDLRSIDFPDISEALEYFYDHLIAKEYVLSEKNAILQNINRKYQDLLEKQDGLEEQLRTANNAEDLRLKGDLLIANLKDIQRGQKEVSLINTLDLTAQTVHIQLDEKLSPSGNAQKYFEEYKKAKRSKDVLERLSDKNMKQIRYLEEALVRIEEIDDPENLASIRSELETRNIVKKKEKAGTKEKASLFRMFRSSDNFQIYVGRNEKENDILIRQESSKYDMWLHAKQIAGSHVIIRNPERKPDIPKRTLLEAAIIAANFSKDKHSSIVPVDYTWLKYVTKPRGAKPGFVNYTHEKTLFVSPEDFSKMVISEIRE